MGDQWPTKKARVVVAIIERHCGPALRQRGSHRVYQGKNGRFTFAFHDGVEINGNIVRRILVVDVGLSDSEARNEVGM